MEHGFDYDFSTVRVHDAPADRRRAQNLSARAFTYHGQIWLGEGQRADYLHLMAHELAHVVQQTSGSVRYDNIIHRQVDKDVADVGAALPANFAAAKAMEFKGIEPFAGTEIPTTVGSGPFPTIKINGYILGPNAIQCLNGEFAPLYYVAYHLERKRNEWVVGPDSINVFKAEAANRAQTAAGNAVATADPVTIPLNRTHAAEMKKTGIEPHYMARSVPYTSKAEESSAVAAGEYELIPQSVHLADGENEVLYYTARNKINGYDQWIVGPDSIGEFQKNSDAYLAGAVLAYYYCPPHGYEAESARFVWGGGSLANSWQQASHDPKFLLQATAAHLPVGRMLQPIARQVRGITAAAMIGTAEVPALTLSAAPKAVIQVVEGSTAQAASQQISRPLVTAATEVVVTEATPAVAARVTVASPAMSGAMTKAVASANVKAAAVTAAPTLVSVPPEIDQGVERSFVEHASTTGQTTQTPLRRVERSADAAQARSDFNASRDNYAQMLQVAAFGQVHHAIEVQVLSRYPGVYIPNEINQIASMRGIPPELNRRTQLHNSKIREVLDRHYRALDQEITRRGLSPGTPDYNTLVRAWMNDAVAEIDYTLGQFFSEQRAALFLGK